MRVVAIVQARMGSTRLPGKVLADLDGAPMACRVVARARLATRIRDVWVACSEHPADDTLAELCRDGGVPVARGSEADVLSRYCKAAAMAEAEVIVRLTADCPLLDPEVIDRVVAAVGAGADYAANVLERSYPRGLDAEAFTADALARMDRLATTPAAREHVTLGPRRDHPTAFATRSVRALTDDSDLRWTVDTADDLERVREAFRELDLGRRIRPYREVVAWCRASADRGWSDAADLTWDPRRGAHTMGERS